MMNEFYQKYAPSEEKYFVSQEIFFLLKTMFDNANCDIHKFRFRNFQISKETLDNYIFQISVWQYVFIGEQEDKLMFNEFNKLSDYINNMSKFNKAEYIEPYFVGDNNGVYYRQMSFRIIVDKDSSLPKIPHNEMSLNATHSITLRS